MAPVSWGLRRRIITAAFILGIFSIGIQGFIGLGSFKAYLDNQHQATIQLLNRNLNASYSGYMARIEQIAAILSSGRLAATALDIKDPQSASAALHKLLTIADVHTGAVDLAIFDAHTQLLGRQGALRIAPSSLLRTLAEKTGRTLQPSVTTICQAQCFSYEAVPVAEAGRLAGSLVVGFLMSDIQLAFNATSGAELHQIPRTSLSQVLANPSRLVRHLPKPGASFDVVVLTPTFDFPKDRVLVAILDVSPAHRAIRQLGGALALAGLFGLGLTLWTLSLILLRPIGRLTRIIKALPMLTSATPNQYPGLLQRRSTDSAASDEVEALHQALVSVSETLQTAKDSECLAIENATQRRVAEQRAQESSGQLSSSTLAFEAERASLAREIHDELGQWLVSIHFDATIIAELAEDGQPEILARAEKISGAIEKLHAGVAALMGRLRPPALDTLGLRGSLESLVQQSRSYPTPCAYSLTISGDLASLDNGVQVVIYRVVQESLTNAAKYAHASHVKVSVVLDPPQNQVRVSIHDDGQGIDLARLPSGNGLDGMRARVAALTGTFRVQSAPGQGLQLDVTLPIHITGSAPQRNQVIP